MPVQMPSEEDVLNGTNPPDEPQFGGTAAPPVPVAQPQMRPMPVPGGVPSANLATDSASGIAAAKVQNERENAGQSQLQAAQNTVANNSVALAAAEQKALQPAHEAAAMEAQKHQERVASFQKRADQDMGQYMLGLNDTQEELTKVIQKQPKDMWEAAGVSKIPGIIGVVLGAIGSKNGQNIALQRIDSLIQRNIEKQKMKAELLQQSGQEQKSLFYMARERLGSDQGAEAALYNAALDDLSKQVDAISNQFKTPKAQQAADQLKLAFAQQKQDKTAAAGQTALQNFYKNYLLEYQQERFAMKARGDGDETIRGILRFNPTNKQAANAAYKDNSAAQSAVQSIRAIKDQLQNGTLSISDYRADMASRGPLSGKIRAALGLGARLEGMEGSLMDSMMPTRTDVLMAQAGMGDSSGVIAKLEAAENAILESAAGSILSADNNAELDPNDPVYGPFVQRQAQKSQKGAAADLLRQGKVK